MGVRDQLAGLYEIVRAGHRRHPLVGDEQGDLVAAASQLAQQVQTLLARGGAHDAVALGESSAKVAGECGKHGRLVIDREYRWAPLGGHRLALDSSACQSVATPAAQLPPQGVRP